MCRVPALVLVKLYYFFLPEKGFSNLTRKCNIMLNLLKKYDDRNVGDNNEVLELQDPRR